jgi:outer membrane receptor for ferrienterochelin and colicin
LTTRIRQVEVGSSLLLSGDASTLGQQLDGSALRATESLYLLWQRERMQLRVGAEAMSAVVKLTSGMPGPDQGQGFVSDPGFTRQRDLVLDPQDFLNGQPYASSPNRSMLGAYAELRWNPWAALRLTGGVRADAFIASADVEGAISPMVRARYNVTDRFDIHGAFALTHKPRTSPLALPGLNDISLDRGVEAAVQSELGVGLQLDPATIVEANAFFHHYNDVVYLELILDCQGNTDPNATPGVRGPMGAESICRNSGLPTASGDSYGFELFLKRDLTQRLSGFLSYTHAYANATARDGTLFTPQSDVRHLANAVLLYRIGGGWSIGARTHFRTGKVAVNTILDVFRQRVTRLHYRLPPFFRLDVHLSYAFRVAFGQMTASVGLQNATFSREATNRDCITPNGRDVQCEVDYQPYIVLPNVALRGDF